MNTQALRDEFHRDISIIGEREGWSFSQACWDNEQSKWDDMYVNWMWWAWLQARAALSATPAAQAEQETELRRSLSAAEATISERNAEIIELHKRLKAAQAGKGEVVSDEMALAFHRALTDAPIGQSELDEIKAGLRAALANTTPQPQPVAVPEGFRLVLVDRSYDQRAKALIAFNQAQEAGQDRDDALKAAWDAAIEASPTPPAQEVRL